MGRELNDCPVLACALVKSRRAWLITWEWNGNHAKVEDRLAGILNYRLSRTSMERIVERIYAARELAIHEQLAYAMNPTSFPYRACYSHMDLGREVSEKLNVPSTVPDVNMIFCGDNPYLRARLVGDLRAYLDENGSQHLKWKERPPSALNHGHVTSEWEECHLIR